nr:uncharacterized protein LOC111414076 [Onthophagus taurus]
MYRQIKIHDEDLSFQRIVWRENEKQKLQTYELSTLTYGLSCAPFLAIRCIHELANENSSRQPLGAATLLRDTYVDDILSGAHNVDEVQELIFQLNRVLMAGGFNARKWTSNYSEALTYISSELIEKMNTVDIDDNHSPRALGLIWNNVNDHFLLSLDNIHESSIKITKRSVLSFIARLFDPLGWLSPLIITAKIIMQDLWTRKLDWDESLPHDLERKWLSFINEFRGVPTIRVPRWLGINKTATSIELHGFSDVSNSPYGAVIYLRVSKLGEVKVSIMNSKRKVAPLKSVTIPRLELCAAVLLVRLMKRIISVLDIQNIPVQLWSDSTVALSWIYSHPSKWKDYVRNRTIEIQKLSQAQWSYVSSQDNPAVLASRGVHIHQLQNETLWWSGPSWLSLPSSKWPSHQPSTTSEADRERRSNQTIHTASLTNGWYG